MLYTEQDLSFGAVSVLRELRPLIFFSNTPGRAHAYLKVSSGSAYLRAPARSAGENKSNSSEAVSGFGFVRASGFAAATGFTSRKKLFPSSRLFSIR